MKQNDTGVSRKLFSGVLLQVLLLVSAACSSSSPASPPISPTGPPVTIDLAARSISFDKSSITVPAGAAVTLNFTNQDAGIPHNFALYTDAGAARSIFVGKVIPGGGTITYTFTAPATPGVYIFYCDLHRSTMTGRFIVQ